MEQSPMPSIDDLRRRMYERAAASKAETDAAVEADTAHFDEVERAALDGLTRIAEEVRDLPPQNKETLGPLWPGNVQ